MVERRYLGVIEVDSGTILVGDPTYLLARRSDGGDGADYQEVSDADPAPAAAPLGDRPILLIQNFGGDGTYPVYGEFEDGELLRIYVDFDPSFGESD